MYKGTSDEPHLVPIKAGVDAGNALVEAGHHPHVSDRRLAALHDDGPKVVLGLEVRDELQGEAGGVPQLVTELPV